MSEYDGHYDIEQSLADNPRLVPAPELYDFADGRIYASAMNRLAQPLPTGAESPFSNQSPGSGHSVFLSTVAYMQSLLGHQINLMPDVVWIRLFRMLGVELEFAQYPVINLVFYRDDRAVSLGIPAEVRLGTAVISRIRPNLKAITTRAITIGGTDRFLSVPARLNQMGALPKDIARGEFSILSSNLAYISGVSNDGTIVSEGRTEETLAQAMLRAREGIRTGNLGRFYFEGIANTAAPEFLGRCVNPRDYAYYARRFGAEKVNVLTPLKHHISDIAIVVYPGSVVALVKPPLLGMTLADQQVDFVEAEIIPINGTITVRVVPSLTDEQVRNLAAVAISQKINPPGGIWGDLNFYTNLATVLENVDGIFAVPQMNLKHATTNQPLAEIEPEPWQLFEIQSSIVFDVKR